MGFEEVGEGLGGGRVGRGGIKWIGCLMSLAP